MRDYVKTISDLRNFNANYEANKLTNDAADAIEELLAKVESYENQRVVESEMVDEMYAENERLKSKVPRWISVEDEPPKEKGDYWCNVRSYNFDDTYYQHEVWFDGESFVIDGICTDRVTHWMPLPNPPKEELNKNVE